MPDTLLFLKAMGTSAIVSLTFLLAMGAGLHSARKTGLNAALVVTAIGIGLALGYWSLALQLAWPPRNGLDRLLALVIPAVLIIELIAGFPSVPRWVAWLLRVSLAAALPRILLHKSVYISGPFQEWSAEQAVAILTASGLLLAGVWGLLSGLVQRSPGISLPLAIQLSTLCAGLTVMLEGYIKGGAAALPLAATLMPTAIAAGVASRRWGEQGIVGLPAMTGVGVVGLFGLLFIGHFFGQLSIEHALVILLAPLLCSVTELPGLRRQKPWVVGFLRLVCVLIPLVVVLFLVKQDFDRDLAPLLESDSPPPRLELFLDPTGHNPGQFLLTHPS